MTFELGSEFEEVKYTKSQFIYLYIPAFVKTFRYLERVIRVITIPLWILSLSSFFSGSE